MKVGAKVGELSNEREKRGQAERLMGNLNNDTALNNKVFFFSNLNHLLILPSPTSISRTFTLPDKARETRNLAL